MPTAVVLDGQSLTLDDVVAVAVRRAPVELAPAARARMEQANGVVAALVESGAVAYGVTTGFGKLSEIAIPPDGETCSRRTAMFTSSPKTSSSSAITSPMCM